MPLRIGYRIVSTFLGSDNSLWWKVQRLASEGESRWEDVPCGVLYENPADAVERLHFLAGHYPVTVPQ